MHSHATPVDGCFGCKVAGVGFGSLRSRSADPVQKVPVVADEGARAGQPVGQQSVHWDGRQDTTVFAPKLTLTTQTKEF
jgi:hypothetical protein